MSYSPERANRSSLSGALMSCRVSLLYVMSVERWSFLECLGYWIARDLKGMVLKLSLKVPNIVSKFLKNQSTHQNNGENR